MAHRIFTGSFEALEARLFDVIAEQQAGDALAPVAVLVGSNILAAHLKIRIAVRMRSAANVRYYTFLDLVSKLCSSAGVERPKPRLPHLGASLLLTDVLEEHTPEAFRLVAAYAGFRAVLLDTFRDLRDAGITPEALEKSVPALNGLTPDRAEHIRGLSLLYRSFHAHVSSFQDAADDFRRASAAAAATESILGTRSLLIYGIYDVTGIQADLLRSLKDAMDLAYFIPYVNESASRFATPFLEARIRELDVSATALRQEERQDSLGILVQRIFPSPESRTSADAQAPIKEDGSFAIVSAPGASRTAVEVVREVLRAAHDCVIAGFHEAAVILRRPEDEIPILTEAFRLRRIPYFVHGGSAFSRRPLARAILAIVGLEAESFSRRAILTAMEMIAAALPADAATNWNVPQWRALVNNPRFLAGIESWDAGTDALVRGLCGELQRAGARVAAGAENGEGEGDRILSSIPQVNRRLEAATSLRSGWAALRQAAAGWPALFTWQEWTMLLEDRLEPLLGRSEDWPAFSTVFDDLSSLGDLPLTGTPHRRVTRARIASVLAEAVDNLSYAEGRFQRQGVNLLSAAAARGLRFPLVIIPGLEEGRFPARLRQDPLLLDAERMQIGRPPRLALKSLRGEEEKLLFDMAVRSAEKKLVVMTSRLDEASDRERIPSQFYLLCAAAARGSAPGLNELNPESVPGLRSVSLDNPGPGRGQIAVDKGEIRLGLMNEEPCCARTVLTEIAQAEPLLLDGPIAYDRARWTHKLTEYDGRILDSTLWPFVVRKLLASTTQFSASRIEEYAKCPYLFYLRRIQELEKWEEEEQVEGIDPLVRGQIVHGILESFVSEFKGEKFVQTALPVLETALSACARRMLEESRPAAMPDLLWEIERDRLLATLQSWLRFEKERGETDWRPVHLERAFGIFAGVAGSPAYQIQGPDHAIEFRGRIDRIDVSPDGCRARVIDYKTGALPASMSPGKRTLLMSGEKIQLAVYCGALAGMEDLSEVESVQGEYLHLQTRDGSIAPCAYGEDELHAAMQRLSEMMAIIREGIGSGVFFARASGSVRPQGHCEYCDFLIVCGKDRQRRQASKSEDPAVRRFSRLQEIDGAAEDEE